MSEGKVINFVQSDTREFPDCSSLIKETSRIIYSRNSEISAEQDCLSHNPEIWETHPTLISVTDFNVMWHISLVLNDEVAFMQPPVGKNKRLFNCTMHWIGAGRIKISSLHAKYQQRFKGIAVTLEGE